MNDTKLHFEDSGDRPTAGLLDLVPLPVVLVDIFGTVRYANRSMRQLLAPFESRTMPVSFPGTFAISEALDWTTIWTELVVRRSSSGVVTFDAPASGATQYQAEIALVDVNGDQCALIALHRIGNPSGPARTAGRTEDLALAKILIDAIPAAVFAKDRAGRYVLCNQEFEEFIGHTRDRLLGRGVFELWEPDLAKRYHDADTALFNAPGFQVYEAKVKHGDGSRRDVVFHKATFNDINGEVAGMVGVMLDITTRKLAEERSRHLAEHDMLTGLPNRHWLMTHLPQAISHAATNKRRLGVLFIDLDNFKSVNDTFGHADGDALLQAVASRLSAALQGKGALARLSGDEFMAVLGEIDGRDEAEQVAQRIQRVLAHAVQLNGRSHHVAVSMGIGLYPDDAGDAETLLKHADIAMYAAKEEGRNRYHSYSDAIAQRVSGRLDLQRALKRALHDDEFFMVYQPRVDPADGTLLGLEALVRWQHPARGIVSPGEFIPIAEQSGVIVDIGHVVIEKVCAQVAAWALQGLPLLPVSVNVSACHFNESGFARVLQGEIRKKRIASHLIEVEITESAVKDNIDTVISEIQALTEMGIKIHLDDFGTGYSSLSLLHSLNVDVLKIDRSFTAQIVNGGKGRVFVEAMLSIAKAFGLRTVVEGVETIEQLRLLRSWKCDEIQGYLISRPVSAADAAAVLANPLQFAEAVFSEI